MLLETWRLWSIGRREVRPHWAHLNLHKIGTYRKSTSTWYTNAYHETQWSQLSCSSQETCLRNSVCYRVHEMSKTSAQSLGHNLVNWLHLRTCVIWLKFESSLGAFCRCGYWKYAINWSQNYLRRHIYQELACYTTGLFLGGLKILGALLSFDHGQDAVRNLCLVLYYPPHYIL